MQGTKALLPIAAGALQATAQIPTETGPIPEFREVWSACSDEPIVSEIIPVGSSVCSDLAAEITGGSGSSDDDDDDDDSSDGGSNDDDDGNTGTRQAVSLVGAIMAAGMVVSGLY